MALDVKTTMGAIVNNNVLVCFLKHGIFQHQLSEFSSFHPQDLQITYTSHITFNLL